MNSQLDAQIVLGRASLDPRTIREAFHDFDHILGMIADAWMEADRKRMGLLSDVPPTGDTYKRMMCDRILAPVWELREKLRSDLAPRVLPHCDPTLRDRVQRVIRLLDIYAVLPSTYGETERWRQQWQVTELQAELDELRPMLLARGDVMLLEKAGTPSLRWGQMDPVQKRKAILKLAPGRSTKKEVAEAVAQQLETTAGAVTQWIQRRERSDAGFRKALALIVGAS